MVLRKKELPLNSAASCLPLTSPSLVVFSSQTVCGGAAVRLQLSWEQRASPILWPFVSLSLPLLAGRSGGAFVTGEPLIKFPLHPWPAAGARRDGDGGGGGLSDSWHWTGLLFLRLKPFWCLWVFRLWAPEPGIAGHDLLMMSLPPWHEMEVKPPEPATPQTWQVFHLCSLKCV